MTSERIIFISFDEDKGGNFTFGNNALVIIMGKGEIILEKGKTKAQNVLYVKGIKHNLLSVSQMRDQGHEVTFRKNKCVFKYLDVRKNIIKEVRTLSNVYVLEGDKEI